MHKKVTYRKAGVDRRLRAESKKHLAMLKQSYQFSLHGEVAELPYGNVFPLGDIYLDLAIEGVGTKVLLAQLANKYDTIGIDGVAMVVNDVIRSGARPLAIVDNIHIQASDPHLIRELIKGITTGAEKSECIVAGGEIGDVAEVIKGLEENKGFDIVVACLGETRKDKIIRGTEIKPEDVVIGLRSSGLHSNGITLARKILFKQWGGRHEAYDIPERLEREVIFEALEPTKIYVKPLHNCLSQHRIKGAVHITGDAYLKFNKLSRFSKGIGFELNSFKPQPIFELIQETAEAMGGISDEEMLKTFNMGWGFAIIVEKKVQDDVLDTLKKSGVEAEVIGHAKSTEGVTAVYKDKKLVL